MPIPGSRREARIRENGGAAEIKMTREEVALIDDAVEAAMQQLEEKRTMGLRIEKAMHGFVSASVYNYCGETAIEFVEGLPKTTKKQTELHGFGLKSVRRICEKYGGTMDVYVEEEFFNVNMLFPVRAEEKEEGAAPHSARAAA